MAKEILLYSYMYDFVIANIITEINAAEGQEIKLRVNTPGGDVLDSYGLVAKLKELKTEPSLMVDGKANSMGAFLCCYIKKAKGLDVSTWAFHRAAYPQWFESNPTYFTPEAKEGLLKINNDLRAAMEGKIKASEWKKVTGTSLDDLFSMDGRIEVIINADQALKLGLIDEIVNITPEKRAEIQSNVFAIAAQTAGINAAPIVAEEPTATQSTKILKPNTMTIEKLMAEHPDVYAAAVNKGVTAERDRVGSFLAFIDVDAEAAVKGIKDGGALTQTLTAEFSLKAIHKQAGVKAENDNAAVITTDPPPTPEAAKTEEQKKLEAFNAEVDAKLGLKK